MLKWAFCFHSWRIHAKACFLLGDFTLLNFPNSGLIYCIVSETESLRNVIQIDSMAHLAQVIMDVGA